MNYREILDEWTALQAPYAAAKKRFIAAKKKLKPVTIHGFEPETDYDLGAFQVYGCGASTVLIKGPMGPRGQDKWEVTHYSESFRDHVMSGEDNVRIRLTCHLNFGHKTTLEVNFDGKALRSAIERFIDQEI